MAKPNAKMKITKGGGVSFQSNVEHVIHTMEELIHAANRDVGKYLRKVAVDNLSKEYSQVYARGHREYRRKGKYLRKFVYSNLSYWARKRELDLQIGFKGKSWFTRQEIGENFYPKKAILRNTVYENIPTIITIESQYITELSNEKPTIPPGEDVPSD